MIIQITGLPCIGKSSLIKTNASLLEKCKFKVIDMQECISSWDVSAEIDLLSKIINENQSGTNNFIIESVYGFHSLNSNNIHLYSSNQEHWYSNIKARHGNKAEKYMLTYSAYKTYDLYSQLQGQRFDISIELQRYKADSYLADLLLAI